MKGPIIKISKVTETSNIPFQLSSSPCLAMHIEKKHNLLHVVISAFSKSLPNLRSQNII